jgi:hypothetical protein
VRSRLVDDPEKPFATALDRSRHGYLVIESQGSVLLDEEVAGVVTVADGAAVFAYERRDGHGGRVALGAATGVGPSSVRAELYTVEAAVASVTDRDDGRLAVTPDVPAGRLADDTDLAARARDRARRPPRRRRRPRRGRGLPHRQGADRDHPEARPCSGRGPRRRGGPTGQLAEPPGEAR